MDAATKLQKARMWLMMNKPFYASLMVRLQVVECPEHPTVWVDGKRLGYNREFIEARSFEDLTFILAHEATHCALLHPYRREQRDLAIWNQACDHAVNLLMMKDLEPWRGAFPGDALFDRKYEGMRAEAIYAAMVHEQQQQQQQSAAPAPQPDGGGAGGGAADQSAKGESGDEQQQSSGSDGNQESGGSASDQEPQQGGGQGEAGAGGSAGEPTQGGAGAPGNGAGDPSEERFGVAPGSRWGDVLDAQVGDEAGAEDGEDGDDGDGSSGGVAQQQSREREAQEWEAAVALAAAQEGHEGASGAFKLALQQQREASASYSHLLRLFMQRCVAEESSWSRPSHRGRSQGIYLPVRRRTEATGKMVVVVDTSGSIGTKELEQFEGEMRRIHAELRPEEIVVLYCDRAVKGEERIGRYDEVRFESPRGGGGTRFEPAFARVQEMQDEGEEVAGLIYLTDLDAPEMERGAPEGYEVVWVSTDPMPRRVPKFGEVIYMI